VDRRTVEEGKPPCRTTPSPQPAGLPIIAHTRGKGPLMSYTVARKTVVESALSWYTQSRVDFREYLSESVRTKAQCGTELLSAT